MVFFIPSAFLVHIDSTRKCHVRHARKKVVGVSERDIDRENERQIGKKKDRDKEETFLSGNGEGVVTNK